MMNVIGGRLADEVDANVMGPLAAGHLDVRVGPKQLDGAVVDVGHPLNGLGQPVQACTVANLIVDGKPFSAVLRWGDDYLSRWTLLVGHTPDIAT
jgi:hypothetical protein